MNTSGWLQLGLYVVVLLLLAKPLGAYMAAVYDGRATFAQRIGGPLERLIYRGAGVDPEPRHGLDRLRAGDALVQPARRAGRSTRCSALQQWLPLNPQQMAAVSPDSSFNTATSFITNTNWQGYGGESTMSYLTQMLGLAVQNFVSAATRHGGAGRAGARLRRARRPKASATSGSISTRTTVYILLPLSLVFALVLVAQGVPQTFDKYATVTLVQPVTYDNPEERPGRTAAQG